MSKVIKLGAALIALVMFAGSAQAGIDDGRYTNQTPYGDPATSEIVAPPGGYEMVFIETIGRHGSRSMTNSTAETRALSVWRSAKKKNALTTAGKRFEAEVKTFQKAELKIGYGRLTTLGKAEWQGVGRRTAENYKTFFESLPATDKIQRITSSVTRTKESASYMRIGMDPVVRNAYADNIVDKARLELSSGSTSAGRAAIERVKRTSTIRNAAKGVLLKMYTKKYVDSIKDPVAAAQDVYLLYCTGAAMQGLTRVTFANYFSLSNALTLGYVKDTENFYRYGPGVAGQTNSYAKARPLLTDFFTRLDDRIDGGHIAAVFRHGHGETTMPFAALIKAPGSEVQVPSTKNYTRSGNPWRGYVAGVPAGSIEWVAYKNAAGRVLVTMRYNEKPVDFKDGCNADPGKPHFYEVGELKRCLL